MSKSFKCLGLILLLSLNLHAQTTSDASRPRARDLGIIVGVLPPGNLNAITDVSGVQVGHTTVMRGDNVRTGVTAIVPHGGNLFQEKVPAAIFVGNGFGKLMGSTQVRELGEIETPILLTSTLNVFSVDLQRQLPGSLALTVGYVGSRGEHLGLEGSDEIGININQLDPKYLALGSAALDQQLPNPFLGNPNVPRSLSTPATLSRARLLRPFPQYSQINARQVTEGISRYHAGVIELTKRMSHGIGGRFSYTYSVLKDNQIGETNFYSPTSPALAVNNYNYLSSAPSCFEGQEFTTACYDPRAEYGYGILDVPHRVIFAPVVELPFGAGRKWATGRTADFLIGGWTIAAAINLQSGFPLNIQQAANARLGGQNANRPNIVPGVDMKTSGSFADRLASADHPTATWINPAAFSLAPTGTFGDAPRTITEIRTPPQYNVDASFIKNFRLTGDKMAQLKIEALNMFDRPNLRTLRNANTFGNANFGQITTQAGFMRIVQIMFRFTF
jgi:Peptidase family S58